MTNLHANDFTEQSTEDLEYAQWIRDNYNLREIVRVTYNEGEDQYAVTGGIEVKGLQSLYIKGLTVDGYVATAIIPMKYIVNVEDATMDETPYQVEARLEAQYQAQLASMKSTYEERTLEALRAANEDENAQDWEGRAARVTSVQEAIWDENSGAFGTDTGATTAQGEEAEFEKDYLVNCARCGARFDNLKPYWEHLDKHDMSVLDTGKYDYSKRVH